MSRRGTRVEILENTADRFAVRRTLPPGTGKVAAHRHTNVIEPFEVIEGGATGSVDGKARVLEPGDVLEVPVGLAHVNPHPGAAAPATIVHSVEPRPSFVEMYFASWLGWLEQGVTDAQDEPTLLQIMAVIKSRTVTVAAAAGWLGRPWRCRRAWGADPRARRRVARLPRGGTVRLSSRRGPAAPGAWPKLTARPSGCSSREPPVIGRPRSRSGAAAWRLDAGAVSRTPSGNGTMSAWAIPTPRA